MAAFGWRPFFIVLGLGSLLWLVPWIKWMPQRSHALHPDTCEGPTLLEFVQKRSAWGTCVGLFCGNYVNYFLITWLPYYLVRERHFSLTAMAKIGGTAYLLGACASILAGLISDRWIASGQTPTRVRKTITGGGIGIAGICLGLCVINGPIFCVVMIVLGVMLFATSSSNLWAITQTLAGPQAAGRWTGFQNCVGNFAGVIAPALTGFAVGRTGHFYWAWAILTMVALAGTASWVFLVGPVEPIVWTKKFRVKAVAIS